jgi:hypothetical protein
MLTVDNMCCQGSTSFNGEKVIAVAGIWQKKRE